MLSQYKTSSNAKIKLRESDDMWGYTLTVVDGERELDIMLDADDVKELALFLHRFSIKMV